MCLTKSGSQEVSYSSLTTQSLFYFAAIVFMWISLNNDDDPRMLMVEDSAMIMSLNVKKR